MYGYGHSMESTHQPCNDVYRYKIPNFTGSLHSNMHPRSWLEHGRRGSLLGNSSHFKSPCKMPLVISVCRQICCVPAARSRAHSSACFTISPCSQVISPFRTRPPFHSRRSSLSLSSYWQLRLLVCIVNGTMLNPGLLPEHAMELPLRAMGVGSDYPNTSECKQIQRYINTVQSEKLNSHAQSCFQVKSYCCFH